MHLLPPLAHSAQDARALLLRQDVGRVRVRVRGRGRIGARV